MVNATRQILSAMLASGVFPVNYKPRPEVVKPPRADSPVSDDGVMDFGRPLLVGPYDITYLRKVNDMLDPACHVEPYQAAVVEHQTPPPYSANLASIFRYRRQRSVNLGSWYVSLASPS